MKKTGVEGYHQKGSPKVTSWDGTQGFLPKEILTHYYKIVFHESRLHRPRRSQDHDKHSGE